MRATAMRWSAACEIMLFGGTVESDGVEYKIQNFGGQRMITALEKPAIITQDMLLSREWRLVSTGPGPRNQE